MRKTKLFGTTLIALTLAASTAWADEFADGFMAAEQGDYVKAAQKWQPLAKDGNASAQFNMALLYHSGAAGKIDETRAVKWYHKAAENGHMVAQQFLAAAYAEGWFGLKKDPNRADYWEARLETGR